MLTGLFWGGFQASAQQRQPAETLPGFKAENVLEARGIDNVNPFNGDPGVVIPIGPEYTLSSAFKWQLKAYYSVKFWNFQTGCTADSGARYAYVLGDPALGAGWTLQLGYVVYSLKENGGWTYFSPDGGQHAVNLTSGPDVTTDGSHLRVTAICAGATCASGTAAQTPDSYKVEFPDGSVEFFEQKLQLPQPPINPPDFTNLAAINYNELPLVRYGLARVQDRFGNDVLKVNYNTATSYWLQPASIVLNPDSTGTGPTVFFNWSQTTGSASWPILTSVSFPAVGSLQRTVAFSYGQNGLDVSVFPRNGYSSSAPPFSNCPQPSPSVVAPLLSKISFSDASSSFAPFSYQFSYFGDATLQQITLPTSGKIQYTYRGTTGTLCLLPSCDPEAPSVSGSQSNQTGCGQGNLQPYKDFLDNSAAVDSRVETDPTTGRSATTYYRRQLIGLSVDFCTIDDSRLFRRVTVTSPGNDITAPPAPIGPPSGSPQFITRSYFRVDPLPPSPFQGAEVDRRYYASVSTTSDPAGEPAGLPVRTLIRCYGHGTPTCGYRDASRNLQQYNNGVEPPQAEVTWYGAVPTGLDGGTCGSNPSCTESKNTPATYNATVGQYGENILKSTLTGVPTGWLRTTSTNWTPQTGSKWMLDLYSPRTVTDSPSTAPASVQTTFDFNLANGFLNSTKVSDASYGDQKDAFTNHDAKWNPTAETQSTIVGGTSTSSFTDTLAYQDGVGKLGGLVLSVQRTGVPWKSFDVDRDANSGLITTSRDPNPALATSYSYDALGRLKMVTPPGEAASAVSYVSPRETTVTRSGNDGNSTWQRLLYDGFGRLSREIRAIPSGAAGSYSVRFHDYDLAGHPYYVSEWKSCANGAASGDCETQTPPGTTSSNFDPFGRPQTITKADATRTCVSYASGAVTVSCGTASANFSDSQKSVQVCVNGTGAACTGGTLATTTYQSDALGRLISVKEPDGNMTTYTYNVLDKLTGVTQGSQSRSFGYDSFGNLRSETTPEKGTVTFTQYDALGDLGSSTEANGVTLSRTYEPAGRLLTLTSSEGRTYLTNTYDQVQASYGRLSGSTSTTYPSIGQQTATTTLAYSSSTGRLQTRIFTLPGQGALETDWAYNTLGLVSSMTQKAGSTQTGLVSYSYSNGYPASVNGQSLSLNMASLVSGVTYHPYGGVASFSSGSSATTTIGADPNGLPRPSSISTTYPLNVNLPGWSSDTYTYDGAGNITAIGSNTYRYDLLSRIASASIAGQPQAQTFTYDRWGNMTQKGLQSFTIDANRNRLCDPARYPTCTYDAGAIVAYDSLGNLTRWGSTSQQYFYDALSRQTDFGSGGATDSYVYDGAGERVARWGLAPDPPLISILNDPTTSICTDVLSVTVELKAVGGADPPPGARPYTWTATGLNGSISLAQDAGGARLLITAAGTYNVTVRATDTQGAFADKGLTITVVVGCSGSAIWDVQPKDDIVCPGQNYTPFAAAHFADGTSVIYKWQVQTPSGGWLDLPASSFVTCQVGLEPGTCLTILPSANTNFYRVLAKKFASDSGTPTRIATAWVGGPIQFQAHNGLICAGQPLNLRTLFDQALGCNLTMTWQKQNADGSWADIIGGSVSPTQTTFYRAVMHADSPTQTVYSSPIEVDVIPQPAFTQVPPSRTFCDGSSVTVTATANSQGIFRWDRWDPGLGDWVFVTRSVGYSASTDTQTFSPSATTDYRITFSGWCGVITTGFTLTKTTVPSVWNVPATLPICPPQVVTYNATVSGGTSLQWQQSISGTWTAISGATSVTWATPMLTTPGTYYYRLAATNSCGTVYSTTSTVTVMPKPSVAITGPCSISSGETATLVCNPSMAGSFYWSPGGQTTSSIQVSPTTTTTYTCSVMASNGCSGSGTYTVAVATHIDPPVITAQPQSALICSGMNGTVSVSATGTNVAYQWQKQNADTTWSSIAGATASSYSCPPSNANYRVIVSNACGSVTSTVAQITVDATVQPATITSQPQSTSYCTGGSATLTVGATGTSVSYLWLSSTDGNFWTPTGSATASLAVSPSTFTRYKVRVSNSCRTVESDVAFVTPVSATLFTNQPQGGTYCASSVAIWVGFYSGDPRQTYQWTYNGSAIAGATSNSVNATAPGYYQCTVTYACGTATSNSAYVNLVPPPTQPVIAGNSFIYPGEIANLYIASGCYGCAQVGWSDGQTFWNIDVMPDFTTDYTVQGNSAQGCPSPQSAPFRVTVGYSGYYYGAYSGGGATGSHPISTLAIQAGGTITLAHGGKDKKAHKTLAVDGSAGTRILAGDWDGDGVGSVGFYDPKTGTFSLWNDDPKGKPDYQFVFGLAQSGLQPIAGDWDGDGIDTVGLYDPLTGKVVLKNRNTAGPPDVGFLFKLPIKNGIAVVGDWTSKGYDTVGVYDPETSVFYLKDTNISGGPDHSVSIKAKGQGALPLAGDWDDTGFSKVGLYDPASGEVRLRRVLTSGDPHYVANFVAGADQVFSGRWNAPKHAPGGKQKVKRGSKPAVGIEPDASDKDLSSQVRLNLTPSATSARRSLSSAASYTRPLATQAATPTWNYTLRDENNRPSIQYHLGPNGGLITDRLYAYLSDRLVATYEFQPQSGVPGWVNHTADHLGSIRLDGATRHDYWPFGEEAPQTPLTYNSEPMRFAGMERDPASANDYDHARYCSSPQGRFLSPDLVGGDAKDPQS